MRVDDRTAQDPDDDGDFILAMNILRYSFFVDADLVGWARPFNEKVRRVVALAPDRNSSRALQPVLDFIRRSGPGRAGQRYMRVGTRRRETFEALDESLEGPRMSNPFSHFQATSRPPNHRRIALSHGAGARKVQKRAYTAPSSAASRCSGKSTMPSRNDVKASCTPIATAVRDRMSPRSTGG
jgi:hypothetical protein